MNNEKNFLIAIVVTVVVLVFYPLVIKQFFPQLLPTQDNMRQEIEENKTEKTEEIKPAQGLQPPSLRHDKTHTLETPLYILTAREATGEIEKIVLLDFIDPETQQPTVLTDTQNKYPGIFSTPALIEQAELTDVRSHNKEIVFEYARNDGLQITKKIMANDNTYGIDLQVVIKNNSSEEKRLFYELISAAGIRAQTGIDSRFMEILTLLENGKIYKKAAASIKKDYSVDGNIKIVAFKTRYFALALSPELTCDYVFSRKNEAEELIAVVNVGVGLQNVSIPGHNSIEHNYLLYAGPADFKTMGNAGGQIEEIRGRGFFVGFSEFLLLLLRLLNRIFKNYGLSVIGLSLLINIVLYPLTFKSLKSMKEMQALQPQVEALRNEFKDNPQKLNKEIMGLYKKQKVNPIGGCLPLVFQMPVFFSLYQVLMRAVELRGADFLWIKDLSSPDALFVLSNSVPFIGNKINILPILMVILSYVQQKKTNPGQVSEQQKMMAFLMPVFLGVIFYNFPSGLVLYFLTNTIFSLSLQVFLFSKMQPGK